jgi:signal transduction histidine kinase
MKDSSLAPPAAEATEDQGAVDSHPQPQSSAAPDTRSRALSEILSQLNRDAAPEDSARALLPPLVAALGVDTGAVLRVVGGSEAELLAAFGHTRKRGFPYPLLDLRDDLLAPLMQRSDILALSETRRRALQPALRAICHPRFGSAFVASAFMGHALGGFVVLSSRRQRTLSADDAGFLSAATDAVGLALGSAALSQETHMSAVVLETAGAVARAISGSLDLAETFRQIARSAARVMGDCNCLLLATDNGSDDDLVAVACSDARDDLLLGLHVRFRDVAGEREALARRRSIVVEDLVWGAATSRDFHERLDIRSALFVPIHSEDELIGSLLLYSTARRDRYSEGDIARAETVAEQAASAICNARLYRDLERSEYRAKALLDRITRIREAQRLTVANVLHDDIVQTVVAALYQVEGLRAGGGERSAELERVAALLKQTINDARSVIWDLRPPVLDGLGLDGALAALASRVSAHGGFVVETNLADMPQLPPRISTALYVIAREALQNARRHARTNKVTVRVQLLADGDCGAEQVCLRVADDGIGFDCEAVQAGDHFGLTMMDEQAALAGGTLAVTSRPGAGTTVEVTVPFSGPE